MEYSPSKGIQAEETMRTGTYVGNGDPDRVVNIGFTPKVIWIYPVEPAMTQAHAVAIEGYASSKHNDTMAWGYDDMTFQGIVPDGFLTGHTPSRTNASGNVYFWIASP